MDLKDYVGLFKIGLALFVKEGPRVIQAIQDMAGERIFLDLKFHDIPETMRQAATALMAVSKGSRFVTVHTSEGEDSVRAAVEAVKGNTKILGVTVLTSSSGLDVSPTSRNLSVQVRVLAMSRIAKNSGCAGIVCSGYEAKAVKEQFGQDFLVVTPGIRPGWATVAGDDQQRVMTPREAILNGADYIVVGRPIHKAKDPVEAANRISNEIKEAHQERVT